MSRASIWLHHRRGPTWCEVVALRLCIAVGVSVVFLSSTTRAGGAAVEVRRSRPADRDARAYERVDLDVLLARTYDNPFDSDEIAVDVDITSPDGKTIRLPAFWDADAE